MQAEYAKHKRSDTVIGGTCLWHVQNKDALYDDDICRLHSARLAAPLMRAEVIYRYVNGLHCLHATAPASQTR